MIELVAFLVVISVLIFVHELGHYVAARSVGIAVPRFSIGMGPRVTGFNAWGTEWVISAVPLGGYVKLAGMGDEELGTPSDDPGPVGTEGSDAAAAPPADHFDAKPLWARAWVISAGIIFNMVFAFVTFVALFLWRGDAVDPTTQVAVSETEELTGVAAPLAGIPFGAELVAVGETRVETRNDISRAFSAAPVGPVTLRFADADPVVLRMPRGETGRIALLEQLRPLWPPVLGEVVQGSPADAAGLVAGDRVVRAGGEAVRIWHEFVRIVEAHPEEPLALEIERNGEAVSLTVTPEVDSRLDEQLRRIPIGLIGVRPAVELQTRSYGPGGAAVRGAQATWDITALVGGFLRDLVTGAESARDLGGPLAIAQISGDQARLGIGQTLNFMALLSVNLAILNLLPIPVLDGGHLLFLGMEAARGRPLSLEARIRLSHLGLILVVGLMVWVITNDFLRFFGI